MVDNPAGDDVYYEYGAPGAAYNAAGRVTKETAGTLIDQYRYGALGEVVKKTRTIDGKQYSVTWKWDNFGGFAPLSTVTVWSFTTVMTRAVR